jgi:hypothetical protein
MTSLKVAPASVRIYRLTDLNGQVHPVLDDLYDSFEAALLDASNWWQGQGNDPRQPMAICIEVSTPKGNWRTLHYPSLFPAASISKRWVRTSA